MKGLACMTKKSLVIVGNGMATGRLLDELLKRDPHRFQITVIGDEPQGSYNRIMLSPVLAGEVTEQSVLTKPREWYQHRSIEFIGGARVTRIDSREQWVCTDLGQKFAYDELVLATGSRPARIGADNQDLEHIYSFRTLEDVQRIGTSAQQAQTSAARALVVGGGLLGLEAAYGLACRGLKVTLVHRSPWLLNRQLDASAGASLRTVMECKHIEFQLGTEVKAFEGRGSVQSARLRNGVTVPCDLAVIATGIVPNKELGLAAGLAGERGIQVDELMRTSIPSISALGECVQFADATFGLVEPIWHQCVTLAQRLCDEQSRAFVNEPVATKLKVSGVQVFSAGEHLTGPEHRELIYKDPLGGVYRKLLLRNNRIVGMVLFGDTRDGQEYFAMMQSQQDVSACLPQLVLGRAFYSSNSDELAAQAA